MPGSYPAAPPTLSGDLVTISRFLDNPLMLRRRLRNFVDLRFVSDQVLTQRFRTQGGAVLYEQTEPFVSDRTVVAVDAGSEYPYANLPTGNAAIASVSKWGQKVFLSDEEITRNVYGGAAVDRQLRKVVNSIIKQVDGTTMSAISSAVTATSAATATWATVATRTILLDILKAVAVVVGTNLGYNCDTVLMSDTKYALMMTDASLTNAWQRETTTNPVYTGQMQLIAGLSILKTAAANLPGASDDVWVLDSTQLGGMADEQDGAPGYAVSDLAVEVQAIRQAERDGWDLQGRRKTVPVVQETAAACKITGT
jgi:hypothetical protein